MFSYDSVKLNKGDSAPFNGIEIDEETLKKMIQQLEQDKVIKEQLQKDKESLISEIQLKDQLLLQKDKDIEEWKIKYNSEVVLREAIDKKMLELKKENSILWTTNNVGWSIGLAAISGIILYSVLNYYAK
jgi:predicted kinase